MINKGRIVMKKIFTVPKYTDDEVGVYHPICEYALGEALKKLNLQKDYAVKHHYRVGNIVPDFVIINKHTQKILMIIEVKRTRAQVNSTRFKNQTRSYVLEASKNSLETPYYVLTNLEITNFFKYDSSRTSVNKQILSPSPLNAGTFNNSFSTDVLIENFVECISIAKSDSGHYLWGYEEIVEILKQYNVNFDDWHTAFTVIGYEFIKSILNSSGNLPSPEKWKTALYYEKNPDMLLNNIKKVNFTTLTNSALQKTNSVWDRSFLNGVKKLAGKAFDADELTSAIHEYLVQDQSHLGVVPTDLELAMALSALTINKTNFSPTHIICDPAAGGGNLIAGLIDYLPQISPEQIKVNDISKNLSHLLSLRLGLRFANKISPSCSPKVSNCNIIDLPANYFDKVNYILMNPPYLSGVSDKTTKENIFNKLEKTYKVIPITKKGQMPLEGPFLEYLIEVVKPDTVIGVILPKSHLFGRGEESKTIRSLLIEKFGLKKIFVYPQEDLFKSVSKETVILVGQKGAKTNDVSLIQTKSKISDVNINELSAMIQSDVLSIKKLSVQEIKGSISEGWRGLLSDFNVLQKISQVLPNQQDFPNLYRGKSGNSGATDYFFVSKSSDWANLKQIIPSSWLKPAIENTNDIDNNKKYISKTNVKLYCLAPPINAFIQGTSASKKLDNIINHIQNNKTFNGNLKQGKKIKTFSEIKDIIKKDSRYIVPKGSLIIPRNLRKTFKAYITKTPMVVSSNFFVIEKQKGYDNELIHSWLLSVFGQLQLESFSKLQEGARKSEKNAFTSIKLPNINNFPISKETSRDFYEYGTADQIDSEWARKLDITIDEMEEFNVALYELIMQRNP